jgi:hypothetical protein
MTCFHIALLLPLVLTGRTTGVLAANDCPTVAAQQRILLPPFWPEALRQTPPFQSPVRIDADLRAADVFSPYDMYYANGLYWGDCGENPTAKSGSQANNRAANSATNASVYEVWSIGTTLGRYVQSYMPQLAACGKTAFVYASKYWKQTAAFVRDRETCRAETRLHPHDKFGCVAKGDRAMPGILVLPEPAERLYVTICPYNKGAILATLGKVRAEYRWGPAPHATLLGEFYQIDDESCPTFAATGDFAASSQSGAGEANQVQKAPGQTSAAPSVATWWEQWARWWLGDRNVVFRNISRQIAGLDWTILLTGKPSDLSVRSTAPAANSVAR